ncbi:hypothetical protein TNIN_408281 [Trichonephila inaurata madagascariensis]|uniref:Uncharacterized protein n=1 Tax=Trichonephila inaurata madagascariensis TaxID=2747483 RepID=A0A8X6XNB0_9ARAC|nr:hypothetical protein TNIN_408281 [Trichonephila inaurata madagascariensis]
MWTESQNKLLTLDLVESGSEPEFPTLLFDYCSFAILMKNSRYLQLNYNRSPHVVRSWLSTSFRLIPQSGEIFNSVPLQHHQLPGIRDQKQTIFSPNRLMSPLSRESHPITVRVFLSSPSSGGWERIFLRKSFAKWAQGQGKKCRMCKKEVGCAFSRLPPCLHPDSQGLRSKKNIT